MSRAERYAEHIRELAEKYGITVTISEHSHGTAWRRQACITIPPIRGQVTYLTALHEIGHIAIKPEPPHRLDQEVAAWRWALDNTIDEPSSASYRSIARWLDNYHYRSLRRKNMKRSREFDEYRDEIWLRSAF